MGKRFSGKFSLFLSLLLVFQLVFPMSQALAAEAQAQAAAQPTATANAIMLPPSNLTTQLLTAEDVKLTWSSVFGATGYNVYGIFDGSLTLLSKVTSTTYTANDLPEGSYSFVVSTLSADGESGPCAPVTVDIVYPDMAAPATLTSTVQNGTDVVLNWAASQYADSYKVYQLSADGQKICSPRSQDGRTPSRTRRAERLSTRFPLQTHCTANLRSRRLRQSTSSLPSSRLPPVLRTPCPTATTST